jgi:hypothetical protein
MTPPPPPTHTHIHQQTMHSNNIKATYLHSLEYVSCILRLKVSVNVSSVFKDVSKEPYVIFSALKNEAMDSAINLHVSGPDTCLYPSLSYIRNTFCQLNLQSTNQMQ